MKELYYGKIIFAVPTQKRPPDKYASHPYPYYHIEFTAVSISISGEGVILPQNRDYAQIKISVSGEGVLRSIRSDYKLSPELLNIALSVIGDGEIVSVRDKEYSYSIEAEKVNIGISVTGKGTNKRGKIVYNVPRENTFIGLSVIGIGELL